MKKYIGLVFLVVIAITLVFPGSAFAKKVPSWYTGTEEYVTGSINNKKFGQNSPKNNWSNLHLGVRFRLYAKDALPKGDKEISVRFFKKKGLLSWEELSEASRKTTAAAPKGKYYPSFNQYADAERKEKFFNLVAGATYRFVLNVTGEVKNMQGIYAGLLSNE